MKYEEHFEDRHSSFYAFALSMKRLFMAGAQFLVHISHIFHTENFFSLRNIPAFIVFVVII